MAEWYYSENGTQRGPVGEEEIRAMMAAGTVTARTLVWRDGMDQWRELGLLAEWGGQMTAPQSGPHPSLSAPANSGLAIASLCCGIGSLVMLSTCFLGILAAFPGAVCGHMALKQLRESEYPMAGRGMAIAGLVTSYITVLATLAVGIFFAVAIAAGEFN